VLLGWNWRSARIFTLPFLCLYINRQTNYKYIKYKWQSTFPSTNIQHVVLYTSTLDMNYLRWLLRRNRMLCRKKTLVRLGFADLKSKQVNSAPNQLLTTDATQYLFFLEALLSTPRYFEPRLHLSSLTLTSVGPSKYIFSSGKTLIYRTHPQNFWQPQHLQKLSDQLFWNLLFNILTQCFPWEHLHHIHVYEVYFCKKTLVKLDSLQFPDLSLHLPSVMLAF